MQRVGARLAAVADRKLPYEFVVLNNSELNPWVLPGGKIAINRGLLMQLSGEAVKLTRVGTSSPGPSESRRAAT